VLKGGGTCCGKGWAATTIDLEETLSKIAQRGNHDGSAFWMGRSDKKRQGGVTEGNLGGWKKKKLEELRKTNLLFEK